MISILNFFLLKKTKNKKKLMTCCDIDIPSIFIVHHAGQGVRTFAYLQVHVAWRWCELHHWLHCTLSFMSHGASCISPPGTSLFCFVCFFFFFFFP